MSIPISLGPPPQGSHGSSSDSPAPLPGAGLARPRARRDVVSPVWIAVSVVAAVMTLVFRQHMPQPLWTMVHVITLGVLTNAILHWTWFFAKALLRLTPEHRGPSRDTVIRLLAVNAAFIALVAGMWSGSMALILGGTLTYALMIAWHGVALAFAARTLLASRFAVVIRYYIAAAAFFVLAAFFAALVATTMFVVELPAWFVEARDALTIAHMSAAVFGWVGLTIAGTLVTLWPTMLRTRMAPQAVELAMQALPVWSVGTLVCVAGALIPDGRVAARVVGVGAAVIAVAGAAGVGVGVWRSLRPGAASGSAAGSASGSASLPSRSAARPSAPSAPTLREYPALGAALALLWLVAGVAAFALVALQAQDLMAMRAQSLTWLPLIGAGGLVQLMLAALSYLTPVATGGGPRALKIGVRAVNSHATLRLAVRHLALIVLAVQAIDEVLAAGSFGPVASVWVVDPLVQARVTTALWIVVVMSVAIDLANLGRALILQRREARSFETGRPLRSQKAATSPTPAPETPAPEISVPVSPAPPAPTSTTTTPSTTKPSSTRSSVPPPSSSSLSPSSLPLSAPPTPTQETPDER